VSSMEHYSYNRRKWVNRVMLGLCAGSAGISIMVLLFILGYILFHGISFLNLSLITNTAKPMGETGGGMRDEIIGTLILVALATAIGLPTGLMAGIFLSEFGGTKMASAIRFIADVLTGLPSIVVGVFAYAILVRPLHSFSALAGGVALSIIMIPIIARTSEESLRLVPNSLREAALALGISRWRTVLSVVIPGARTGIITGGLLATARIAGETAPLLFTSLGNYFGFQGVLKPISALPLSIYHKATSPYSVDKEQAWAASLLLILMVLIISIFVRWLASRGRAR